MTRTVYQQSVERIWKERRNNPEWRGLYTETLIQLQDGEYSPDYVDILFQNFRDRPADIYDAISFITLHGRIRMGRISLFQVPVGERPVADKATERQNKILSQLQYPFSAKFWGGQGDFDGKLWWEKPIHALTTMQNWRGYTIVPAEKASKNGHGGALLEVGTIAASKLLVVLALSMVARWPYGQDCITVLVPTEYYCCMEGMTNFEEVKADVWGDFHSLPNPYDEWSKWKEKAQ